MRDLKFSEATAPDVFRRFWKDAGWQEDEESQICLLFKRELKPDKYNKPRHLRIQKNHGSLWLEATSETTLQPTSTVLITFGCEATLGEALDAANELANTTVFGGWQEVKADA